jgi:hypothetical protein
MGQQQDSSAFGKVRGGCLAHRVGDATERAYVRGDMLEKRFNMLNIWADYLISKNESN